MIEGIIRGAAVAVWLLAGAMPTLADDDDGILDFKDPLVSESPTTDEKLRVSHIFRDGEEGLRHLVAVEVGWAFVPWASIEINPTYTFVRPLDEGRTLQHFDDTEVILKFASGILADHGILLGGGLEVTLPTGDRALDIGNDRTFEISPFVDGGFKIGHLETSGFLTFEIPVNEPGAVADEVDLEITYNLALMYEFMPDFWALFEFDGGIVAAGDDNEAVLNVGPGLKVDVDWLGNNLEFGAIVSFPVTADREFDVRTIISAFYVF